MPCPCRELGCDLGGDRVRLLLKRPRKRKAVATSDSDDDTDDDADGGDDESNAPITLETKFPQIQLKRIRTR